MFGWNSPAMAFRYIEAAQIANEGTARVTAAQCAGGYTSDCAKEEIKNYSSRLKTKMATAVNRRSISNQLGIISAGPIASRTPVAAEALVACLRKRIECCFVVQGLRVSMHAKVHIDKHFRVVSF